MYDIPLDRSFLQLSNGVRHVMPSTDTKPELTAKASMAQPISQPAVYANGLNYHAGRAWRNSEQSRTPDATVRTASNVKVRNETHRRQEVHSLTMRQTCTVL
jgi:hypothetical protein